MGKRRSSVALPSSHPGGLLKQRDFVVDHFIVFAARDFEFGFSVPLARLKTAPAG